MTPHTLRVATIFVGLIVLLCRPGKIPRKTRANKITTKNTPQKKRRGGGRRGREKRGRRGERRGGREEGGRREEKERKGEEGKGGG